MRLFLILLLTIVFYSCSDSGENIEVENIDEVPIYEPKIIAEFSEPDTIFFSYLAPNSEGYADGSFVVSNPSNGEFARLDTNGRILNILSNGPGPGEIIASAYFKKDKDGNLHVSDLGSGKILEITKDFETVQEFIPDLEYYSSQEAFPLDDKYIFLAYHRAQIKEGLVTDNKEILIIYELESGDLGSKVELRRDDKINKPGMSARLPYNSRDLIAYNSVGSSIIVYNARSGLSTELGSDLDTLSLAELNLPREEITGEELKGMRDYLTEGNFDWAEVQRYYSDYPEKPMARWLSVDDQERLWLQSYESSDRIIYYVASKKGDLLFKVKLPHFEPESVMERVSEMPSIVTHIKGPQIGLRYNNSTFILLEDPNLVE